VETLTGFKYIGEKLQKYEMAIPESLRSDYRNLSEEETRKLRLEHSSLYVFGGEESYGYSGSDFVRDKDGNSAAVMIAEAAAFARSEGTTLVGLLDRIYAEFGFFLERGESLVMDGAEGASKIRTLVESYANTPPTTVDGSAVVSIRNFAKEDIRDVEGDLVPKEDMLIISLADGRRVAVRPSGTEPKIKYYMFAEKRPAHGAAFDEAQLAEIKPQVTLSLTSLWDWLKADAATRA
jgi:phosphoglucomutase